MTPPLAAYTSQAGQYFHLHNQRFWPEKRSLPDLGWASAVRTVNAPTAFKGPRTILKTVSVLLYHNGSKVQRSLRF